MKQMIYQVDAFTDHLFGGNPAAVCPLENWLPDSTMQNIAMENNLAETAFFVKEGEIYHIRWFTPMLEVDLCGHATLATAFVLFERLGYKGDTITFTSRSGFLHVSRKSGMLTLDFPADTYYPASPPPEILNYLNIVPLESYKGKTDWMFLLKDQKEIEGYMPDYTALEKLDCRGVILTAKGRDVDFVSRFFAPQSGITEDPVTGSAHTTLAPFWAERLGKKELTAMQLSPRKGHLRCKVAGDRVEISGQARIYMSGEIHLEN